MLPNEEYYFEYTKYTDRGSIETRKGLTDERLCLSDEEKRWFDHIHLYRDGDEGVLNGTFAYDAYSTHCRLPIVPPEVQIEFVKSRLLFWEKGFEMFGGLWSMAKFTRVLTYVFIRLFFSKRVDEVVTGKRNPTVREGFQGEYYLVRDIIDQIFNNKKHSTTTRPRKKEKTTWFDRFIYDVYTLHTVVVPMHWFFKRNYLQLKEYLDPSYPDHRPPQSLNDWLYQIDAIREEYRNQKIDV